MASGRDATSSLCSDVRKIFAGAFSGLPGVFEVTYDRPDVLLNPINIRRVGPSTEGFRSRRAA